MREIKFRAWDAIAKKMWTPIVGLNGVLLAYNHIGGYVSFPAYQDPLMQYTGLKDKNGKEIYFDDIYRSDILKKNMVVNEIVVSCWIIDINKMNEPLAYVEIIGNIYEHEHLLK